MASPHKEVQHAVILGAGLAGLSAAIRLKEHGVPNVVVLERAERPGGLAISLQFEGLASDLGPHRIYTEIPEVERFYTEVAGESMLTVRRQSSMFLHGQFLTYPLGFAEMLKGPGPVQLTRFAASWIAAMVRDSLGLIDKQTYEGVMHSAFGKALYDYLIGPYTAKVWKTDPNTLDADAARVRVSAGSLAKAVRRMFLHERKGVQTSLREFHYVKGGVQTLVNRLVEKATDLGVTILTQHEVVGFRIGVNNNIEAVEASSPAGNLLFIADSVISTIPLPHLMQKLNAVCTLDPKIIENVSAMSYLDLILVFVIVARERVRKDHWIYFPESKFVFNRTSEAKAFDPHMGAQGRSILCVETTCRPGQDLSCAADPEIIEQVLSGLYKTGMFRPDEVLHAYVHRLPFAYPVYHVNSGQKLEAALHELTHVPNLVTTGRQGLFNFNNMDHSIYMGMKAGDTAATAEHPSAHWLVEYKNFRSFRIG